MKFKVGQKVKVNHTNGMVYTGKILDLYTDHIGNTNNFYSKKVDMAKVLVDDGIDYHEIVIGQCLLESISQSKEDIQFDSWLNSPETTPDIVTETSVVVAELLRDNEKILFENDSLKKDLKRADNMIEIITAQYKDIQESNTELREQLKLYRKGIVN